MRVLLDENLPHRLRREFVTHELVTVAHMGWRGVRNGKLLAAAAAAGFDVFVTSDQGIEYEQDPRTLPIAVIVLLIRTNAIESIRPLYPALNDALRTLVPRTLIRVGPLDGAN